MKSFRFIFFSLLIGVIGFLPVLPAQAQEVQASDTPQTVDIYFFYGDGCPHCEKERIFLNQVLANYSFVQLHDFEVWKSSSNRDILQKTASFLNVEIKGVPFTVIGTQYISGYLNDETSGEQILKAIAYALSHQSENFVEPIIVLSQATIDGKQILGTTESEITSVELEKNMDELGTMTLPLIGEVNLATYSLPLLTIIIGGLDGFNPCAMWVLIFLISLLVNMGNKRRMWILGGAFIGTSAFVYFLFLAAWLNFFLFIGLIVWVRLLIGLVALTSGGYNIREYFTNKDATCKVTANENRKSIFDRLKKVTQNQKFLFALGGIILLAFAVNLVELVCSAGLPAVYTQVLALSDLPRWEYYLLLLLYIFVFMLDDMIVFVVSMITLQITGLTTKYTRYSFLIGGILMLVLGALLILKPEVLMFG
ncbi:hypothetical protein A2239_00185 [Candidatus Uhrbacteria bacterium RIFOXYA2_FULL_40_9]|nr:MAG: hypothetical protein A2239_00185 [Candidatus Uhrbacteria bacterium RIFOXYA2_FULL_40_9]